MLQKITVLLLLSFTFSKLHAQNLAPTHLNLLQQKIYQVCDLKKAQITITRSEVIHHKVDQGVNDFEYTTEFKVIDREDGPSHYDTYKITLHSFYSDGFNHDTKEWGTYSILSHSNCEFIND